jgi:RNA polymerase sigma-70 factor (ECF subfamily)
MESGMPSDLDEFQDLMQRLRSGSEEAVQEFLDRYGHHIYRAVRYRLHKGLRTRYDSQDFVQAVCASFLAQPVRERSFDKPDRLIAYLSRMAFHKIVDAMRGHHREKSLDGSAAYEARRVADHGPSPSQVAMANERWHHLKDGAPHPAQRILELLRMGVTHKEIAARLGVSEKTVRRLVRSLSPERRP